MNKLEEDNLEHQYNFLCRKIYNINNRPGKKVKNSEQYGGDYLLKNTMKNEEQKATTIAKEHAIRGGKPN